MQAINQLKIWLSNPENGKAKLASLLGYDSSVVIGNWVRRKKIPKHQLTRVLEIIRKEQNVTNKKK